MDIVTHSSLAFDYSNPRQPIYARKTHETRKRLEHEIAQYYQCDEQKVSCSVCVSGLAAISIVVYECAQCTSDDEVYFIFSDELYSETVKAARYVTRNFLNIKFDFVNSQNVLSCFKKYGKSIKLLFIESCSNPSGQIFDFALFKTLKELAPDYLLVADNTWTPAPSFNPLQFGADVVIESLTKYRSAGKCIGGMIVSNLEFINKVNEFQKCFGQFIARDHCVLFLTNLQSLESRLITISQRTREVLDFLCTNKDVYKVVHPSLESHPSHSIFNKYIKYVPGCIWIFVKAKCDSFKRLQKVKKQLQRQCIENCQDLHFKTSYGGSDSRIDPFISSGQACMYGVNDGDNAQGIWLRLAIGFESDLKQLCIDLQKIFLAIQSL